MTTAIEFPETRIRELLETVELTSGHHTNGTKACPADLINMALTGEWSDRIECVHPILNRLIWRIADHPEATQQDRLDLTFKCGPLLLGTADRDTHWAVMVSYRSGLTASGFLSALESTADRADLSGADLSVADLSGANLSGANLEVQGRGPGTRLGLVDPTDR